MVTEKCSSTVDVWLGLTRDFATLQGMILAKKEYKDMENVFGDLVLEVDYGLANEIVTQEERNISKYHSDRIKASLGNPFGAYKASEDAITWAGRTFADKIVNCECGK